MSACYNMAALENGAEHLVTGLCAVEGFYEDAFFGCGWAVEVEVVSLLHS